MSLVLHVLYNIRLKKARGLLTISWYFFSDNLFNHLVVGRSRFTHICPVLVLPSGPGYLFHVCLHYLLVLLVNYK